MTELEQQAAVVMIPLDRLLPWDNAGKGQPRQHFDSQALQELADSMTAGGFIGSIVVRPYPGRPGYYEILAGHRRTRAATLAHLQAIPATVREMDDQDARFFVLQDNLQRQDFLPWEEGAGYAELVADGAAVASVAGRVGKSPSYVAERIAIHQGAGERARRLYLRKELTLQALELVAALPDRPMAPVQCSRCRVVLPEGSDTCAACGQDLAGVWRCDSGNPQDVAALLCRGKVNGAVAEIVAQVAASYGLGAAPVQTSLGFDDVQITQEAVKVRTELERKLADVANLRDWFLRHLAKLEEYTPDQRAAVVAQCEAAEALFRRIREAAAPPAPAAAIGPAAGQDQAPALALAL